MKSAIKTSAQHNTETTLQAGWQWVKLAEICIQDRQIIEPNTQKSESLSYYSLEHIESNTGRILKMPAEQIEDVGKSTTFYFDERHVLYGKLRPYLNKVAMPNSPGRCTTELIPLKPIAGVDRAFLVWLLRRPEVVEFAMQDKTGSRMPRADMDSLLTFEVPLPPLPEQKRIAAILNEQIAAVNKARSAARERLEAVKSLPAAFLREVFPQPEEDLPAGWRWVKLGDVCELNPRRPSIDRKDNELTSFIPMESVDAINGFVRDLRMRPYGEVKKGYTYFAEDDVLFAKITPCMQNGKHAIARGLNGSIGFGTTEFHVLRPGSDVISEWIHFFVRHPSMLMDATEHFTGSVGQQRLPQDYLSQLELPLPPLFEQKRIAAVLNEQMAGVDKVRTAVESELKTIDEMPAALLRQAFNGEI